MAVSDAPLWPVVMVDDSGWVSVAAGPGDLGEPGYADEVIAAFDRAGRRFTARDGAGVIELVAASEAPDLAGLTQYLNEATARWAPDLAPLVAPPLISAFRRAHELDVGHQRRLRRMWSGYRFNRLDRRIGRLNIPARPQALLDAADDVAEALTRYGETLGIGLDVEVTDGRNERSVPTWGVLTFAITDRGIRQHWELLAYRRAGELSWTEVQTAQSVRGRTEAVLESWAARSAQ